MRVFIYEYTCGAGAVEPAANPIRREGLAMLETVLDDFTRVPGVEPICLVHERCAPHLRSDLPRQILAGAEVEQFQALAGAADYTLIIAPEFDSLLETRCRWAEEAGSRLLGPSPEAVSLTGDKLALGKHLRQHGVSTPPVRRQSDKVQKKDFPLVIKPRHGAGSRATLLLSRPGDLDAGLARARAETGTDELLLQPLMPGRSVSVAFLVGPQAQVPLLPAAQHLSADGRFRFLGGSLPLPGALARRAVELAGRSVAAVPGLRGYVGVDLVLGQDGDVVLEINPRITTSYVGLRAMTPDNLAEAMLRVVRGMAFPALRWRPGSVRFWPDGRLRLSTGPLKPKSYSSTP
jgi:predicted ATP-grasp superfamily ATP-dependent carboligase